MGTTDRTMNKIFIAEDNDDDDDGVWKDLGGRKLLWVLEEKSGDELGIPTLKSLFFIGFPEDYENPI